MGAHAPRNRLGGAAIHFIQPFKNTYLSKNLDQDILKRRILEKRCKIAAATPIGLQRFGAPLPDSRSVTLAYNDSFVECVSSVKRVLLLRKITEATTEQMLCFCFFCAYIFHFKSADFVDGGTKLFFASGHRVPLGYSYATADEDALTLGCPHSSSLLQFR